MKKAEIYITAVGGEIQAELNGEIRNELYDVIRHCDFGCFDSFTVEYEDGDDIWTIADKIYEGEYY